MMRLLRWWRAALRWGTKHPDDHGYHSDHERHHLHLEFRGGMNAPDESDD